MTGMGERSAGKVADAAGLQVSEEGPAAKKVAVGHASGLVSEVNLQMIMRFAGKDEGVFIAHVCKSWLKAYKSIFDGEIYTLRENALTSLQRIRWIWWQWDHSPCIDSRRCGVRDASWYMGKYAPRSVIEEVLVEKLVIFNDVYFMQGVAASGRAKLLEELWDGHVKPHDSIGLVYKTGKLGAEAAHFGHLQAFSFIWARLEKKKHISYCGCLSAKAAAQEGRVNILEFLSMSDWWGDDDVPKDLGRIAVIHDQHKALRWLLDHGQGMDKCTVRSAAVHGHQASFDMLLEYDSPYMDETFVASCVQHENLDALQWCYDTLRVRFPHIWNVDNLQEWMLLAGTHDCQEAAEFLLQHGAVWPDVGQEFGTWLNSYDDDESCDTNDFNIKCKWSIPFLKWAIARGCTFGTWTVTTCARLAKETDYKESDRPLLDIIAWAHENGCPCDCPPDAKDF